MVIPFPDDPLFLDTFGAALDAILRSPDRPGTFTLRNCGQEYDDDGEPLPLPPVRTHTLLPIVDDLWPGPPRPCGPVVPPQLRDRDVDRATLMGSAGQLDLKAPRAAVRTRGSRRMKTAHPDRPDRPERERHDVADRRQAPDLGTRRGRGDQIHTHMIPPAGDSR